MFWIRKDYLGENTHTRRHWNLVCNIPKEYYLINIYLKENKFKRRNIIYPKRGKNKI